MEHLPEKVAKELGEIARWLVTNGNTTDFLNVYTTSRSGILVRSLQGYCLLISSMHTSVYMNIQMYSLLPKILKSVRTFFSHMETYFGQI